MSNEGFRAQAIFLSARYMMPLATIRKWMVANNIQGYKEWMDSYGMDKHKTNSESHDACLRDITNWVLNYNQ